MSSIHHAPTAEDYLHPTAALTSNAETFLRPLLLLLSIIILQLMLPHHLPPFNYLLLHFIFFSASAFISTLSLLVLIYNLSRLSDDH